MHMRVNKEALTILSFLSNCGAPLNLLMTVPQIIGVIDLYFM